ncbi:MAG: CaiB/BaiF CoA transferase family protein [Candidatus Methylomirabilales bacterium]
MQPLEGLKVIDLSRILAGPYCTMLLGDMGAEVVKVENPAGGDDTRGWGPPFINGESAYFLSINRNKKSITLNLKADRGREILSVLLQQADVLVENFRPGTLEKAGFGYEAVQRLNPRLIYCSISGFGHTGPETQRPGYDLIIQGESGVMSLTGLPDGPPLKVGLSVADIVAGMYAVQGILLALVARERYGKGQKIDIALLDSMISLLTYQAGIFFTTGQSPHRMGNLHPTITPYEPFEAQDGYFNVAVGNDVLWARLCQILGREELINDPRFATGAKRVENRAVLRPMLEKALKARSVQEWLQILNEAGIPCGPINSLAEVFAGPQVKAREMIVEVPHPALGTVKMTGVPLKLSATPGQIKHPPPLLGEHTEEVLRAWLGMSAAEIQGLHSDGVI